MRVKITSLILQIICMVLSSGSAIDSNHKIGTVLCTITSIMCGLCVFLSIISLMG